MPTSNTEELGRFLKCTVIGRGVFGPCACCPARNDRCCGDNIFSEHQIDVSSKHGGCFSDRHLQIMKIIHFPKQIIHYKI